MSSNQGPTIVDTIAPKHPWSYGDDMIGISNYQEKAYVDSKKVVVPVDTIASAKPITPSASGAPTVIEKNDAVDTTNTSPSIMSWLWKLLNTPMTLNPVKTEGAIQSNAPQPATINGTPLIDAPYQINHAAMQKMLKEMRDLSYQIKEISNETEDELAEKDRLDKRSIFIIAINTLKNQKDLRSEGAQLQQFKVIYQIKKERVLRKEMYDLDGKRIEVEESSKFWGKINNWTTKATMGASVVLFLVVGATMFFNPTPTTLLLGTRITLQLTQLVSGVASGITQFIKTIFDKKFGELKEISTIKSNEYQRLDYILNNLDIEGLGSALNRGGKMDQWLAQLLKSDREAAREMNSR